GFFVCLIYLVQTNPVLGGSNAHQWFHIAPASAGIFGVPAGLIAMITVSLLTPPPKAEVVAMVDQLRSP
ncbi:MAG: cation acetate symporter, partial [Betaproteobacteria bacterium]|nr:cation acetate symporter [Betaproteobacteria bacterium]